MHGFQLWANLPSSLKMTDPRYQDIPSSAIPEVTEDDGTKARIICGEFWGKRGPGGGCGRRSRYVDISVPPGSPQADQGGRNAKCRSPTSSPAQVRSATPRNRARC